MDELRARVPPVAELLESEVVSGVVRGLFPDGQQEPIPQDIGGQEGDDVTAEEVRKAASRIPGGKAPGPDGILGLVVWEAARYCGEGLAGCYIACMRSGRFPAAGKKANNLQLLSSVNTEYLRIHYGLTVTVVFDGYSDSTKNIKAAEQRRRTTKTSSGSEIIFDEFMTVPKNQQQFFTNINNKSRFISMLSNKLTAANIAVKQAKNDADVLIIETAIEKFDATNTTIVVGEDVDLLVLLTARTSMDKISYFLKPGRAQQRREIYSSKSLSAYPKCQNYILFLHAITGCDTSSAMYRRGKTSVFKLFEKNDLTNCAKKNSLTLFFAIAKKAVLPNVAVKKSGCSVLQRVPIAKVSLA
ncbi:hypothetical protein M0804_013119 [Polistes exclamans]|nr:hypothetical protein M0804_013119 [Polistes exclamans]